MRIILVALMSFFLAISWVSCTKTMSGVVKRPHTHYGVALPPDTWTIEKFRGADLFFKHKTYDATMFLKAQCEKVSDSPLIALASQMLAGMGKYEIISQNPILLSDREGLVTEVKVKLDGVNRFLKTLVVRKNRCVFDAVLTAREFNPEIVKDFDNMIQTFWAEADL